LLRCSSRLLILGRLSKVCRSSVARRSKLDDSYREGKKRVMGQLRDHVGGATRSKVAFSREETLASTSTPIRHGDFPSIPSTAQIFAT
jgi:hypothetical protein